jgi:hypothetical protein
MRRKEDLAVTQAIADASEITRRVTQEARLAREEALKKNIEAEAALRKTGIVDLLESIRDKGAVRMGNNPAAVSVDGNLVRMIFNQDREKPPRGVDSLCCIEAFVDNGLLIVCGMGEMTVKDGELSIEKAVGMALADPMGIMIEQDP